jgi:hypothetical protein
MSQDHHHEASHFDRVDADAVCEQCGEVNPPETVFCKSCGNNLRDQRMARLNAQDAGSVMPSLIRPRRMLSGLLTVLGLLVVLWTGFNVTRIEQWMVAGMTERIEPATDPQGFWQGPSAALYDEMAAELDAQRVTLREIERVNAEPMTENTVAGRYILKRRRGEFALIMGQAIVRRVGPDLHFVAKAGRDAEIRGVATGTVEAGFTSELTAIRTQSGLVAAFGTARVDPLGIIEFSGQSLAGEEWFQGTAERIPAGS